MFGAWIGDSGARGFRTDSRGALLANDEGALDESGPRVVDAV